MGEPKLKQATTRAVSILIHCVDTPTFHISEEHTPSSRVTIAQAVIFSCVPACLENLKWGQRSACMNGFAG